MTAQLRQLRAGIEYCKLQLQVERNEPMRIAIAKEGERLNRMYLDLGNGEPAEMCCSKCAKLLPAQEFRRVSFRYVLKNGSVRVYTGRRRYCKACHNKQCYQSKERLKDFNYVF